MSAPVEAYIILAAILFFIGVVGVIARRNPLIQLMSIELLFNSANLALGDVRALVGQQRRRTSSLSW